MKARRWADWWRDRCTPWNHDVCGGLRAMALSSPTAAGGPSLLVRALAEGFGCMLFHFVGSASPTPVANGVILMVIVYHLAKVSGAHLNPAVTLTFSLLGHTTPLEMLTYWAAQTAGCIMGAMWIAALVPGLVLRPDVASSDQDYDGCFHPRVDLTSVQVFGWEAVGTFCFLVPIFSVVWYTQNKSGYGNTGPLIVGLSLMGTAMAVGPWTGAALNPARALGSPIVFTCGHRSSETLAYYILGELAGAAAVPIAIMPWYGIAANPWYRRRPASPSRTSSASDIEGPVGGGSITGDGTMLSPGEGSTAGGDRGSTATEATPQRLTSYSSLQRYLVANTSAPTSAKGVAKTEQTYTWAKASTGACDSSGTTNIASNHMTELGYSHRNRPRNSIEHARLPPSTPRSGAECHTPRTAVTSPASSIPLPVLEIAVFPSDERAFGSCMQYRSSASLPRGGSPPMVRSDSFQVGSPV